MRRLAIVLAVLAAVAGCRSNTTVVDVTRTSTTTSTVTHTQTAPKPVSGAPTEVAGAASCPLLVSQTAADAIGMRLERVTVLRSGARVVGCRIYALQGSPLSESEHLPPANQPAIAITTTRYASAAAARLALVFTARRGTAPQRTALHGGTGVCFQIAFYPADQGKDWACAYTVGARVVLVRTVVVFSVFTAIQVARAVRVQ